MEKTIKIKDDAKAACNFVLPWAKDRGPFSLQELQTYLLEETGLDELDELWQIRARHSMSHLRDEIFAQSVKLDDLYEGHLVKLNKRGRGQFIPIKAEETPPEQIELPEEKGDLSTIDAGGIRRFFENICGFPLPPGAINIADELIKIRNLNCKQVGQNRAIIWKLDLIAEILSLTLDGKREGKAQDLIWSLRDTLTKDEKKEKK